MQWEGEMNEKDVRRLRKKGITEQEIHSHISEWRNVSWQIGFPQDIAEYVWSGSYDITDKKNETKIETGAYVWEGV